MRHRIPGEGVLDHGRYVRALAEAGFDRYLVNECFTDAPLGRALSAGYRTLSAALASCGARPERPTPCRREPDPG